MDSPISWIGGKKALRETILRFFPTEYERYIEVFGGGGWVLFHKPPEAFEVYNDYNSNLSNLFYVMKNKPVELLYELGWLPLNGREEFEILKMIIERQDFSLPCFDSETELAQRYMSDLEFAEYIELMSSRAALGDVRRAVAFYKLIRYSYASSCTSYSCQPTSILKTFQTIWMANKRLNDNGFKPQNTRNYKEAKGTGKGVIIENKDFEALIRHYDRDCAFFYCDPPYYETEGHYAVIFGEKDHYRLRDTLTQIQGKFMLSYNDCEFVRSLYENCYIQAFERINNISQRYDPGNMFKELIITNYDPDERQRSAPAQMSLLDI